MVMKKYDIYHQIIKLNLYEKILSSDICVMNQTKKQSVLLEKLITSVASLCAGRYCKEALNDTLE